MDRTGFEFQFVFAKTRAAHMVIMTTFRKEKKCMQACSLQAVFISWWKNGKIAKNPSPSLKIRGSSLTRKMMQISIRRSVVCDNK